MVEKKIKLPIKLVSITLVIGIVIGIVGTVFVLNFNPKDKESVDQSSVVFERIVKMNELVTVSQNYNITDKGGDVNGWEILGFNVPLTGNSFWYRYVGTLKAGVNLENADFTSDGDSIVITLNQPYIISNTPDMDKTQVLEENNNVLNPISVASVDEFQAKCVEKSESEALEGGLLDEAKSNAETELSNMITTALGEDKTITFDWREN